MRLRTLLALMFGLLLVLTAASIGWRGFSNSRAEIKRSTREEFGQANKFTAHQISDFLDDPAQRLLTEYPQRARRGGLPLNDSQALGLELAERLRVHPTLAWISYSDAATGRFTGVWRDSHGNIILNRAAPANLATGSPPEPSHEVIVQPDGTTPPYPHALPTDYDPRRFAWFTKAMTTQDIVWSKPYEFIQGQYGITASRAWRASDGAPGSGVFTVDFFLTGLEALLDTTSPDFNDIFCVILEPDGTLICHSANPQAAALTRAVGDWVKANPHFKDNNQDNSHLVLLTLGATNYLVACDHINAPSGLKCVVASMAPQDLLFHGLNKAAEDMFGIAVSAVAVAAVLGVILAYRISEPLHDLGNDLASVGKFQLADGARARSMVHEVNQLNEAADRMKSGLRSFIKYVPDDLVRQLLASGREAALGGEVRRLTIFLSDIENFTTYSESMPPDKLVHELADYLEILTTQLRRNSGTIDKFIGDGLLAFFNAPSDVTKHEACACRAALAALRDLDEWQRRGGGATFRTRVGLHTGDVLVGNIGTPERFAYTVLGDVVNVSSRLEGLNKIYGTQVLASGEVYAQTDGEFEWRHVDRAAVAGRRGGLEIYELLGAKGDVEADRLARRNRYEKALGLYFARAFNEAGALFTDLVRACPEERTAALMAARCQAFAAQSLPADWDGVFAHGAK